MNDVRPFIAASDLVLLPSKYESFGYATAEAMSMGRTVVGTAVPGTVDLISDPRFGELVPVGDYREIAKAVLRRIEAPRETDRAAARAHVGHRYGAEAVRDELLSAYATAVSARAQLAWRDASRVALG